MTSKAHVVGKGYTGKTAVSNRVQAPAWVNISLLAYGASGEPVYINLPLGIPLDSSGASYSDSVQTNITPNMSALLEQLEELSEDGTYEEVVECKIRITKVGSKASKPTITSFGFGKKPATKVKPEPEVVTDPSPSPSSSPSSKELDAQIAALVAKRDQKLKEEVPF